MENTNISTRERIIEIAEQLLFKQGFSGTSLNDVMSEAELSKGAFFHHFKNKNELAHAVLTRWADNDDELVKKFALRASTLSDDPMQEIFIFIKLFEEWLGNLEKPLEGCLFASFTYESAQFDPTMHAYIKERLGIWMSLFAGMFDRLVNTYPTTKENVTGESLTEMMATIFEGGLLLTRALDDRHYLIRQFQQFRAMLALIFEDKT